MSLRSVMSTLTMAYRDVLYNQCILNMCKFSIFIFPTGWIRVCDLLAPVNLWKSLSDMQEIPIHDIAFKL